MQAVILAGGKGTRLRPLTYNTPKPMVIIHDRPFLEYQLALMKKYNITHILLLVSYLGNSIEKYFGNGSRFGLNIQYSYEYSPMGTGGALKNAENKLENNFLLLNGDTLLTINYSNLISFFKARAVLGLVTVYNNSENIAPNNIRLDDSNYIVGYSKKNMDGMEYLDAGVSVFKKEVLKWIPSNQIVSLEEEIFPLLIEKRELLGYPTTTRFYDIGTFEGLETIKRVLI